MFHFSSATLPKTTPILSCATMTNLLQSWRDAFLTSAFFRTRTLASAHRTDLTHPHVDPSQPTIALLPTIDGCVSNVVQSASGRGVHIKIDISPMVSRQVRGDEKLLRTMLVFLLNEAIELRSQEAIVVVVERNDLRGPDVVRFVVASRDMKRKQYAQDIPFYPLNEKHYRSADAQGLVAGPAAWRDTKGHVAGDLGSYPNANGTPAIFFNLRLPRFN